MPVKNKEDSRNFSSENPRRKLAELERDEEERDTYPSTNLVAPPTSRLAPFCGTDAAPLPCAQLCSGEQAQRTEGGDGKAGRKQARNRSRLKREEQHSTGTGQLDRPLIPHHIIHATDPRPLSLVLSHFSELHRCVGHGSRPTEKSKDG
jgi:hypothetical protein